MEPFRHDLGWDFVLEFKAEFSDWTDGGLCRVEHPKLGTFNLSTGRAQFHH
jgi:hypothetical protein